MESKELTKRNDVKTVNKEIVSSILNRVDEMKKHNGLAIPANYSVANALNSAWLILQGIKDRNGKPALQVCTEVSIANALFDMVIQGLSPAKRQCYFLVYGSELTLFRSYHGTQAALKRLNGVTDVFAQVIYKGDVFEYRIVDGNILIEKHEQKLENIDSKNIVGAYCVIVKGDTKFVEIMNKTQIDIAWSKRSNSGSVQKEFPEEMCKRTVINRAAKRYVNTSDDSDMYAEVFNRGTENEYSSYDELSEKKEVEINANKETIYIDEVIEENPLPEEDAIIENQESLEPSF